mgnify:FL=1
MITLSTRTCLISRAKAQQQWIFQPGSDMFTTRNVEARYCLSGSSRRTGLQGGAEAYDFLGTANYVKHEGSQPMNIAWKLDSLIPAKILKKTNKLVVR